MLVDANLAADIKEDSKLMKKFCNLCKKVLSTSVFCEIKIVSNLYFQYLGSIILLKIVQNCLLLEFTFFKSLY